MKFHQLALVAGFAAMMGLSAASAVAASLETTTGYAPTVQDMLKSRSTARSTLPDSPASMPYATPAQAGTVKPKVGMDPVYSYPKKTVKKKAKKKAPECPSGMIAKDNGCVEEAVVEEQLPVQTPVMQQPALQDVAPTPALGAPEVEPKTPDCPSGMTRDAAGNCMTAPVDGMVPSTMPEQNPTTPPTGMMMQPSMQEEVPTLTAPEDLPQPPSALGDMPAPAPAPDIPAGMPVPCPEGQIWNAAVNACAAM